MFTQLFVHVQVFLESNTERRNNVYFSDCMYKFTVCQNVCMMYGTTITKFFYTLLGNKPYFIFVTCVLSFRRVDCRFV